MTYRNHPAYNQSYLKALCKGVSGKIKIGPAIKMGSIIDCLITTPNAFDKEYYIADITEPTPDIKAIIDVVSEWSRDVVLEVAALMDFKGVGKGKWELDTVWNKLRNYGDYWEHIILSEGKQIITTTQYELAKYVSNLLTTHPYTRAFIYHPQVEVIYQKDFYWKYQGREFKGLADVILINRGKDIIFANGYVFKSNSVLIVDIKTGTKSPKNFKQSIKEFNYYFQLAFYWWGLLHQDFCKGLTLSNPVIVYAQQSYCTYPIWYEFTDLDMIIGKEGQKKANTVYKGKLEVLELEQEIYGWEQSLEILDEYERQRQTDIPHHLYKNGKL